MKQVDDANMVVIPHGLDTDGAQIVDLVVTQPPALPPILAVQVNQPPTQGGAPPIVPVAGAVQDPNAALIQGMLAAIHAMTQVNLQSDVRNTSVTQQQMQLQAATMQSNAQQLQHLSNHLGNLGQSGHRGCKGNNKSSYTPYDPSDAQSSERRTWTIQ